LKKITTIIAVFILAVGLAFAGGSKDDNSKPAAQSATSLSKGSGGKGKSIAILAPQATGLAKEQDYIPALVQGEFVSNFSGYSAISVLDRQRLYDQYKELESGFYDPNSQAAADFGKLAPTDYIMGGNITRTAAGYALQISITKSADKTTSASYSGTFSFAELDNLTGVRRASLDLLQKMGVTLTDKAKAELSGAARANQADAQVALARGITAQRNGTEVAALSYYFQAEAFDPSLLEASNRANIMNASISSGNLGADIRNKIKWHDEWVAKLVETENFISQTLTASNPPYSLFYSSDIKQGKVDYQKETVELGIPVNLRAIGAWFGSIERAVQTVYNGLIATGMRYDWGLSDWPNTGVTKTNPFGKDNKIDFSIVFELVNDKNKVIGRQTVKLSSAFNIYGDYDYIYCSYSYNTFATVIFNSVLAADISPNLTLRIASINNIAPENARIRITAITDAQWEKYRDASNAFNIRNGVLLGFNKLDARNGWDSKKQEQYLHNLTIPGELWGEAVTIIADKAFYSNYLSGTVTIPEGVTYIGREAFAGLRNNLFGAVIPDSVRTIGRGAFSAENHVSSITIGANVDFEPNELSYIDLMAKTAELPWEYFIERYNRTGKRAGVYTRNFFDEWGYKNK